MMTGLSCFDLTSSVRQRAQFLIVVNDSLLVPHRYLGLTLHGYGKGLTLPLNELVVSEPSNVTGRLLFPGNRRNGECLGIERPSHQRAAEQQEVLILLLRLMHVDRLGRFFPRSETRA